MPYPSNSKSTNRLIYFTWLTHGNLICIRQASGRFEFDQWITKAGDSKTA